MIPLYKVQEQAKPSYRESKQWLYPRGAGKGDEGEGHQPHRGVLTALRVSTRLEQPDLSLDRMTGARGQKQHREEPPSLAGDCPGHFVTPLPSVRGVQRCVSHRP